MWEAQTKVNIVSNEELLIFVCSHLSNNKLQVMKPQEAICSNNVIPKLSGTEENIS